MPRGSLDNLFRVYQPSGPFSPSLQIRFVTDIARALKFLHEMGLVHGDLKPANLLVTEGLQIKLTDFDTCRIVTPKMKGVLGTPDYIAPEAFKCRGYSEKVDVYAYGITVWQIATREKPYPQLQALEIPDAVTKGARPAPLPGHVLKDLMEACWQERPKNRPTFAKICDDIENILSVNVNRRLQKRLSLVQFSVTSPAATSSGSSQQYSSGKGSSQLGPEADSSSSPPAPLQLTAPIAAPPVPPPPKAAPISIRTSSGGLNVKKSLDMAAATAARADTLGIEVIDIGPPPPLPPLTPTGKSDVPAPIQLGTGSKS
jgi:serine/threonine protein kinase